jgi:hypothetical protein
MFIKVTTRNGFVHVINTNAIQEIVYFGDLQSPTHGKADIYLIGSPESISVPISEVEKLLQVLDITDKE